MTTAVAVIFGSIGTRAILYYPNTYKLHIGEYPVLYLQVSMEPV
jgi:hypothetical protein